jgi:hypothetical protein
MTNGIPLWLKISQTSFVCLLVPIYWKQYDPGNFLWFSDIALLLITLALWIGSSLLVSMMALSVGLLELVWNLDFLFQLFTGAPMIGLPIRALSLFHVELPLLLFWIISRLGYDRRALGFQIIFAWLVLLSSYFFTSHSENVNWVNGFGQPPHPWLSAPFHLTMLMVLIPTIVYWPTHLLLKKIAPLTCVATNFKPVEGGIT